MTFHQTLKEMRRKLRAEILVALMGNPSLVDLIIAANPGKEIAELDVEVITETALKITENVQSAL